MLINHIAKSIKIIVFQCIIAFGLPAHAGSFEDFFRAAAIDNESVIVGLALRGFDLNTRNEAGEHALIVALRQDSLKVVDFLLSQRAVQPEIRNPADESPLMIAAIRGHLKAAARLIERGAEVNKPGWTALHYAASRAEPGNAAMVRLLLEHHAYIDAESPNRTTPLMMAAQYGTEDVARLLLEEGADPSLRNEQGLTAADFAGSAGRDGLADRLQQASSAWNRRAR
jgi:uncharacterized protein